MFRFHILNSRRCKSSELTIPLALNNRELKAEEDRRERMMRIGVAGIDWSSLRTAVSKPVSVGEELKK
jgi:hypothetical protein